MKAVLLNSIADALHFTCHNSELEGEEYILLSTNPAVDSYMRFKLGIECNCLSRMLTGVQVNSNIKVADSMANQLVDSLDGCYSAELNLRTGFKGLRFFRPLYSYEAYFQINSFLNLLQSLNRLVEIEKIDEIAFYDAPFQNVAVSTLMLSAFLDAWGGTKLRKIVNKTNYESGSHRLMLRINRVVKHPSILVAWLLRQVANRRYRPMVKGKPTVLLYEYLYDLEFVQRELRFKNILYYNYDSMIPLGYRVPGNIKNPSIPDLEFIWKVQCHEEDDLIVKLVKHDILTDFKKNINDHLRFLNILDCIHEEYDIKLGIWGNPPIVGRKALAFEYLLAKGIPVFGCQHGGFLGNLHNSDVFISEATRCTDYISYGFTKEDLSVTYPEHNFDCFAIHSLGTTKKPSSNNRHRKQADLLVPITNTISMLNGGMIREQPDILLDKQVTLLKYLDSVKDCKIIIKPTPYSNYDNLAAMPILEELHNLNVISYLSLLDILEVFEFKAVIIDHVTTPLYELLPYDVELFVLNDAVVRPIEAQALSELKKRVHYFENLNDMFPILQRFLQGKLEKKRDNTFYHHHVYKNNTRENILGLIESLIGNRNT